MKLNQIGLGALRALGTYCASRPVTAIGSTASAITTTGAILAVIDGVYRNVAAITNQALVALDATNRPFYVQPANTTVYYTLATDGTSVRCIQGDFAGRVTYANGVEIRGDGNIPDVPDFSVASVDASGNQTLSTQWCPFAVLRVVTGATTFTPGTTALNAANVTTTIWDVAVLPSADRL